MRSCVGWLGCHGVKCQSVRLTLTDQVNAHLQLPRSGWSPCATARALTSQTPWVCITGLRRAAARPHTTQVTATRSTICGPTRHACVDRHFRHIFYGSYDLSYLYLLQVLCLKLSKKRSLGHQLPSGTLPGSAPLRFPTNFHLLAFTICPQSPLKASQTTSIPTDAVTDRLLYNSL